MKVAVRDLAVSADIGINPDEIGRRQTLIVDVILSLDPIQADEIGATIDYREIVQAAQALAVQRIALIESFATFLAEALLERDPRVRKATVIVAKPEALVSGIASVRISLRQASHPIDSALPDETGH
jgi:dihydroneopterin aldolase